MCPEQEGGGGPLVTCDVQGFMLRSLHAKDLSCTFCKRGKLIRCASHEAFAGPVTVHVCLDLIVFAL